MNTPYMFDTSPRQVFWRVPDHISQVKCCKTSYNGLFEWVSSMLIIFPLVRFVFIFLKHDHCSLRIYDHDVISSQLPLMYSKYMGYGQLPFVLNTLS